MSPRLGGPICAEPLDDESAGDSRQRAIKHLVTKPERSPRPRKPATRGPSLSRGSCKPQIESVKKYMGSDERHSSRASFARRAPGVLRGREPMGAREKSAKQEESDIRLHNPKAAVRETTPLQSLAPSSKLRK